MLSYVLVAAGVLLLMRMLAVSSPNRVLMHSALGAAHAAAQVALRQGPRGGGGTASWVCLVGPAGRVLLAGGSGPARRGRCPPRPEPRFHEPGGGGGGGAPPCR